MAPRGRGLCTFGNCDEPVTYLPRSKRYAIYCGEHLRAFEEGTLYPPRPARPLTVFNSTSYYRRPTR